MLHLEKIDKSYYVGKNRLHVLKSVDLTIDKGEMVSIMGSSGSGQVHPHEHPRSPRRATTTGRYHLDGTLVKDLSRRAPLSTGAAGSGSCSSPST
jgi:putative ABC transport system ATP-binding protein